MIEQLKELLEMQRVLDESIFKAKGITEYPVENMRIALFVELGEMMNELPTHFKHWKSSAVDNREKALVEYVDCLHFALSLTNYYGMYANLTRFYEYGYNADIDLLYTLKEALICVSHGDCEVLKYLFDIGNYLGFAWEEIYNAYKEKNAVNYERLKNGY